jgi:hypothetical protein
MFPCVILPEPFDEIFRYLNSPVDKIEVLYNMKPCTFKAIILTLVVV